MDGNIHIIGQKNIKEEETIEDMIEFSKLEQKAIENSDVVIIILPAGRGTHIELGMAIALNKKVILCSLEKETFNIENIPNFYALPNIKKVVGTTDQIIKSIIEDY